jgi:hypothetical protein
MKSFRKEVGELEQVRQELANAEKLFDLPITMYPDLLDVQKQMKGLEMVYSLYEEQLVGTFKQRFENTEGLSKMDNPEKLATWGTQDEENKTKTIQRNWQHRLHNTKKNKTKTIQRNWQHRVHNTKKNKTKTIQRN